MTKRKIDSKTTLIILAKNIKEAKEIAGKCYSNVEFVKPFRYASKGNNFYEFKIKKE